MPAVGNGDIECRAVTHHPHATLLGLGPPLSHQGHGGDGAGLSRTQVDDRLQLHDLDGPVTEQRRGGFGGRPNGLHDVDNRHRNEENDQDQRQRAQRGAEIHLLPPSRISPWPQDLEEITHPVTTPLGGGQERPDRPLEVGDRLG